MSKHYNPIPLGSTPCTVRALFDALKNAPPDGIVYVRTCENGSNIDRTVELTGASVDKSGDVILVGNLDDASF